VLGGTSLEQVKFSKTALSAAVAISSTTSACETRTAPSPEALLTLFSRAVLARDASLSLEEAEICAVLTMAPVLPDFFGTWPFFGIARPLSPTFFHILEDLIGPDILCLGKRF
jgi:hypothetical protein